MVLHKLLVDDFREDNYSLIAIHCSLKDYRIAYLLNQYLHINLVRKDQDLDFKNARQTYAIYEWKDKNQLLTWNLVSNICVTEEEENAMDLDSLFQTQNKITRTHNLISEYKKVNYLLKFDDEEKRINIKKLLHKINEIPQIATVYSIAVEDLKTKDNLIFN